MLLLSKTAIGNTYGVLESNLEEEEIKWGLYRYSGRLDITVWLNTVSVEADFVWEKQWRSINIVPDSRARMMLYKSEMWYQEITAGRLMIITQEPWFVRILWSTINILQHDH